MRKRVLWGKSYLQSLGGHLLQRYVNVRHLREGKVSEHLESITIVFLIRRRSKQQQTRTSRHI